MNYRDFLQKVIYRIIDPLIKAMIRLGFTPNLVTTLGFIGNVVPYSHISTDRWKTFCHLYLKGISIHRCATRCGVCLKTAQYMKDRLVRMVRSDAGIPMTFCGEMMIDVAD